MANKNANLHNAKSAKNDEFYTQLTDIEKEMKHYREFFRGKVVYCNCDDARTSKFFTFFSLNFEFLGLKKLICTGYKVDGRGVVYEYDGDKNGNRIVDEDEINIKYLEGDGDFRSQECIDILKQVDVVVTNPPFSLFREYVKQLMDYNKKFIIIGNQNAVTFKEIFPLIKENKIWWGTDCIRWFIMPEDTDKVTKASTNGNNIAEGARSRWYTNIEHSKRNKPLDLYKRYNAQEFPKYDNYDAIEVSKTADIPMDYDGVMGVPITFLDKYCPTQFEIVGATESEGKGFSNGIFDETYKTTQPLINGKKCYKRILIRHKRNANN